MAKFVIAGQADCPYLARVELLGDTLASNLPDFKLHKIVVQPNEWTTWLENLCNERGWKHSKSPVVWRELIDRGGKGILIGGSNEFQEYVNGYYGIKSELVSSDMTKIAAENLKTKEDVDAEEAMFKAQSNPINVCVTNASNGIAYNLLSSICKGDCLGHDIEIALHLLDSEDKLSALKGVEMEVFDLAFPLLRKTQITSDASAAFADASVIVILDEIALDENESREEWLQRNNKQMTEYAKVIESSAKPDVKVIVGGRNPVNFNALMLQLNTPSLPNENIVAVSRLLENHAKAVLSQKLNVNSASVVDVVVWGNPVGAYLLDVGQARVHNHDGAIWGPPSYSRPVVDMVHDTKWLEDEFITTVGKRKQLVEEAIKHPPFASQAAAVSSVLQHWWLGSPSEQIFSVGVRSQGEYGIPEDLVFSMPVKFADGKWTVVKDIDLTDEKKEKMKLLISDLQEETYAIFPRPKPPTPPPAVVESSPEVPEQPQEPSSTEPAGEIKAEETEKSESAEETTDGETGSEKVFGDGATGEDGGDDDGSKPSMEKITEDKEGEEEAQVPT